MEYYAESNQDPDFEENEYIYDDLDLEEIGASKLEIKSNYWFGSHKCRPLNIVLISKVMAFYLKS